MNASPETELCVGCGMCCDGTIFTRADVVDDELVDSPVAVHLITVSGARQLPQPCSLLGSDASCTEYEHRPQTCRTYRCDLLVAVADGQKSMDSAKDVVSETLQLRNRAKTAVAQAIGETHEGPMDALVRRLEEAEVAAEDAGAFRRQNGQAYLALAALGMAIEANFQKFDASIWVRASNEASR